MKPALFLDLIESNPRANRTLIDLELLAYPSQESLYFHTKTAVNNRKIRRLVESTFLVKIPPEKMGSGTRS